MSDLLLCWWWGQWARRSTPGVARAGVGWQLRAHPPPAPLAPELAARRRSTGHATSYLTSYIATTISSSRSLSPVLLPATCAHTSSLTPSAGLWCDVANERIGQRGISEHRYCQSDCGSCNSEPELLRRSRHPRQLRIPVSRERARALCQSSTIYITITRHTQRGRVNCMVSSYLNTSHST